MTAPAFQFIEFPREHGISLALLLAAQRLSVRVAIHQRTHLAVAEAPLHQCRLEQARAGSLISLPEPPALVVGCVRFDLSVGEAARVAQLIGAKE